MSNERTGLYEGMFLFPQAVTANLQEAIDHLKDILDKSKATVINFSKWDDRRLAYEIDSNKRGVYFLVYFNAPTSAISELERRCNQSEQLLRMMVTKAEYIPAEIIEANEGADELATEIKLRGEKSTKKGDSAGSAVSRKEDKAPEEAPAPKKTKAKAEVAAEEPATEVEPADAKTAPEPEAEVATEEPATEAEPVDAKTVPEPEAEVADVTDKQEAETEEVTEA